MNGWVQVPGSIRSRGMTVGFERFDVVINVVINAVLTIIRLLFYIYLQRRLGSFFRFKSLQLVLTIYDKHINDL